MAARENARQVREQISSEMWEQINRLYLTVRSATIDTTGAAAARVLPLGQGGVHLFQGITDSTIAHGEGWQFIQVGRFLERASAMATLLGAYYERPSPTGSEADEVDRPTWSGWACSRAAPRSRPTAVTTPPTCARPHRGVPAAERGLPSFGALRDREGRLGAAGDGGDRPARERARGTVWPAACAPLDYGRSTRSWRAGCTVPRVHREAVRRDSRRDLPDVHQLSHRGEPLVVRAR